MHTKNHIVQHLIPIKLNIAQAQMIYAVHQSLKKITEQRFLKIVLENQKAFIKLTDKNSLK